MIFAPVIRRTSFNHPRNADVALQRFLHSTLHATESTDVQVTREDNAITLQLDVPGLARDQLVLAIDGKQVRLDSIEGAPRQVHRAWEVADAIDVAASSAKLENGVFTLRLVKLVREDQSTHLTIQ